MKFFSRFFARCDGNLTTALERQRLGRTMPGETAAIAGTRLGVSSAEDLGSFPQSPAICFAPGSVPDFPRVLLQGFGRYGELQHQLHAIPNQSFNGASHSVSTYAMHRTIGRK